MDVKQNELPSEEMYMAGKSLFPLTTAMAARISREFGGKMRISYAGGADALNIDKLFALGIWPITMATTELKPGGWEVRETAGIEGWIATTDTIQTVSIVSGQTSTVTFTNKEKPGLRIKKFDRSSLQVLADIPFEVWRDGVSLGVFQTDQQGEILMTNLQPGTYVIAEVNSDDDHITDTTPQQIELKAGDGIKEVAF